jgi:asparagine synthase (glutamine-hydrolysing)
MNKATAHRGPDGTGIYENDHITFGHNRLAIIDLSEKGAQPMHSADGALTITYNGELYNYRELRAELTEYPFKSETDTEVILASYAKWGVECFKRFNGIFAFALWDAQKHELILARDHMGIKPLYYSAYDGAIVFSSEIKALLETGVSRELDRDAFMHYLRVSDVVGPNTLFKAIQKLPPAHYAVVKEGVITLKQYWKLDVQTEKQSNAVWQERIQKTLDASVTRQLVSDRPVGVYLSGGIDSSAVLASVIRAQGKARTYTTRFEVDSPAEEEKFNRDAVLARKTSTFFGTEHTEIVLKQKDIIALFEQSVWHLDEPTGSATALSQLMIARETVRDVAVVLGGDGGDELFGGYERYRLSKMMDIYQKLPKALRVFGAKVHPTLAKLNTPPSARLELFHLTKQQVINRVLAPALRVDTASFLAQALFPHTHTPFLEALMNADRQLLVDGSLLRTDKLSMAVGLEARVPILDKEMVELSARIPGEQKISLFTTKKLFKDAVRDRLPAYLFDEPKRGWFAPSGYWLKRPEILAYAKEVLSPSYYAPTASLFDWEGVQAVLDEHYRGEKVHRTLIWTLLAFQVWARRFGAVL